LIDLARTSSELYDCLKGRKLIAGGKLEERHPRMSEYLIPILKGSKIILRPFQDRIEATIHYGGDAPKALYPRLLTDCPAGNSETIW